MVDIEKEISSIIQNSVEIILEGRDIIPSFFLFYKDGRQLPTISWDDSKSNKYVDSRRTKIAVLTFEPDYVISVMEARVFEEPRDQKAPEEPEDAFFARAKESLKDREFDSLVLTLSTKDSQEHRLIIYNTKTMKKLKDESGLGMKGMIGDPYELYELAKSFTK
jgi:hypothetical protein